MSGATNELKAKQPSATAERVRERMKLLGLSQTTVAKRAGVSQAAISELLTGRTKNPTVGFLMAVYKAIELDPAEMLDLVTADTAERIREADHGFFTAALDEAVERLARATTDSVREIAAPILAASDTVAAEAKAAHEAAHAGMLVLESQKKTNEDWLHSTLDAIAELRARVEALERAAEVDAPRVYRIDGADLTREQAVAKYRDSIVDRALRGIPEDIRLQVHDHARPEYYVGDALLGLVEAIETYDASRDGRFRDFALPIVERAIQRRIAPLLKGTTTAPTSGARRRTRVAEGSATPVEG